MSRIEEVEDDKLLESMKEKTGERSDTKIFLQSLKKRITKHKLYVSEYKNDEYYILVDTSKNENVEDAEDDEIFICDLIVPVEIMNLIEQQQVLYIHDNYKIIKEFFDLIRKQNI